MNDVALWVDDIWREGAAPEPRVTVSQWADEHRILPDLSAEPGRWRTSRTPYLREIMDCLSANDPTERVVFVKGAQLGGTEAGLNFLGYVIHHAPGLMLMVQPTMDAVRRNTSTRVDPMIAASPALRGRVIEPGKKEPGNSQFRKLFPGGQLVMVGAASGVGLRSTPARYLFLDEVDAYPADVSGEGDPVALAIQRTVTFRGRRKIVMVSTPTLKGYSRIEAAYEESDRRIYEVRCPDCGSYAPIMWAQIQWPEGRRDLAHRVCPDCGAVHEEHRKPALLASGRWRATQAGDGKTAGFHLSSLYSPFETWAEIAIEHGQVHRDPPRLQVWTNTKLAETWEDQAGDVIDADPLMARREDWGALLPEGVAVLTAGVDVQGDRLELHVIGWGRDEESWSIDYRVIWGDPSGPRVWADLDTALQATYPHRRAIADMTIRAVAVDTGGQHTKAAYEYCRTRLHRRIWAIKGRGGPGIPLWPRRPTRTKGKVPLFLIGVDAAKDALFARLRLSEPGPGYLHFPVERDAEFFRQLTAERVVTRFERGRPIRLWQPRREGERNEALDTTVYAMAALHGLISMGLRLNDAVAAIGAAPGRSPPTPARPAEPPQVIRSQWMT
ncbi:MAG: phage terminase large subunit family protein [Pseudorhodoplanes sp.]|nr:phage terminase large subunit family protein [Pseudorhodoplanes sp.]